MLSKTVEDNLFIQLGQILIIFKEVLGRKPKLIVSTDFQLLSSQDLLSVVL